MGFLFWGGVGCWAGRWFALKKGEKHKADADFLRSAVQVKQLSDLNKHYAWDGAVLGVWGRVHSSNPLHDARGRPVAILQTSEHLVVETRKLWSWARSRRRLQLNIYSASWSLVDGSRNGGYKGDTVELPIESTNPTPGLASVLVDQGERLVPSGERGLDRQAERKLGERHVGTLRQEHALPCGAVVTAVGRLACAVGNPHDFKGAIRRGPSCMIVFQPLMISPKTLSALLAEKEQLAESAQAKARLLGWLGGGLLAGAALSSVSSR